MVEPHPAAPADALPRGGEVPRALRLRHVSFRWRPRVLAVGSVVVALTVAVAAWTMMLGEYPVPPWEVLTTTLGVGTGEHDFVVRTLRLPRTLTALLVGVALATSGAIFQGLVRNPLVAPDIIGVMSGASLAAVATIVLGGPTGLLPVAAFAGAVTTAFGVYALTWRAGIAGGRLVLVGIGINAVLAAGTTFLLVRFPIERITPAVLWLTGTLHARSWRHVSWIGAGVAVLLPLALALLRRLRTLQLGDDTAVALGVRVEPTRAGLLVVGAGLAAVAVAVAGPVGFVALMVPHAVRLVTGPLTGGTLLVTGAAGALLVAASDLVAQHAFSPLSIPVGVVTAAVERPTSSTSSTARTGACDVTHRDLPPHPAHADRLRAEAVSLAYDDGPTVVDALDLVVPDGQVTCIVGPNACGKSTLLRALARLLEPTAGRVFLDGRVIHRRPTKEVARSLGLLPQAPTAPEGLTVEDLVGRGRFPHQGFLQSWSETDERAVETALLLTDTAGLRYRPVDELSGGQRQRVWIAMALAQQTPILLLDEPTTYLDVAHQLEVLDLLRELNEQQGRTIVMVLHDLNEAARYSDHLVAMRDGRIVAEGTPEQVVTPTVVRDVFGIDNRVIDDPVTGTPLVVPIGRGRRHVTVA